MDKNLEIIRTALYHKKTKTLILGDLHLGYEEYLSNKGIFIPKFQFKDIMDLLEEILKKRKVKNVVFNGDIKHEFGTITETEWRCIIKLFDFFIKKGVEVIVVLGNHDPIIKPIAEKRDIKIFKEYIIDDILILHGDFIPEEIKKLSSAFETQELPFKSTAFPKGATPCNALTSKIQKSFDLKALASMNNKENNNIKTIIIGHEHPAISLKENERIERFKCFLAGKWNGIDLIVMPSVNPLVEGKDIFQERLLSPFLIDAKFEDFEVYICGENPLYFGKVRDVKKVC